MSEAAPAPAGRGGIAAISTPTAPPPPAGERGSRTTPIGPSMTVENPVTRWIARWIMRIEAAGEVLRIVLFGGTFLSTGLSALATYGYGRLAGPFVAVVIVGTVLFAYVYAEGGVLNQKNRDSVDIGDNYSGPTMLMDSLIEARQLALLGYTLQNGGVESYEELADDLEDVTFEEWVSLREGVDPETLERRRDRTTATERNP